ncbi:acyl-CoA dehydrogenase [Natronococcus amylolyticus DSM 10524]|uniref:Acyl-CoA dehydrogenase n=1 Tax=Natronococcus amylolyticus DSM 10524 TaxID=1227497 RepID=L9X1U4_9EURY|nr:acyl-CoA dehydrogenase family protein [Natronococcus amylolyticus]ELY55436.1 acyl-CoA dehydrogenase [Natronococcus amylolyticus DSM 10524]
MNAFETTIADSVLSTEHRMLRDETRTFVENEVRPEARERDSNGERMSDDLVRQLGEMGFFGILIDEEYDGLGLDLKAYAVLAEELSRGWLSVGSIIARGQSLAGATEAQKEHYLPKMARGELLKSIAISESEAGSDVANMRTRAERDGDEYVLNGQKMWTTFAKGSDFILTYAVTDPDAEPAHAGISGFIVEKPAGTFDRDGLSGQPIDKIGYHGWDTWTVNFDDVRVGEDKLVGREEGQGFYQIMEFFEEGRVHTAARAVGLARGALEDAVSYAKEREQFDQPIAEFQALRFKLAEMATRTEAARALTLLVAQAVDQGERADAQAAMAKLFATEVAEEVTSDGIQVHGGYGYTTEFDVERYWRDARLTKIFEGTNEIQKRIIADRLL